MFEFRFTSLFRAAALPFGITGRTAWVEVHEGRLVARFGPWLVDTPIDNIASADVTGPFPVVKTIGPPHLSLADRGLTFATNPHHGLCVRFHEPVSGIEPSGRMRHPGLTVTVGRPEALAGAIDATRRTTRNG